MPPSEPAARALFPATGGIGESGGAVVAVAAEGVALSSTSMPPMPIPGVDAAARSLWLRSMRFWLWGDGLMAPIFVAAEVVGTTLPPPPPAAAVEGVPFFALFEGDKKREITPVFSLAGCTLPALTRKSLLSPFFAAFPAFHVTIFLNAAALLGANSSSTFNVSGWKTLLYLNLSLIILTASSTADWFSAAVHNPDLAIRATKNKLWTACSSPELAITVSSLKKGMNSCGDSPHVPAMEPSTGSKGPAPTTRAIARNSPIIRNLCFMAVLASSRTNVGMLLTSLFGS
mmetsp:Transcript_30049/g.50820  ORF Transcript_30049/g.50820 Transcript_30049/m.50820 type:complete len:287 (+) Transcript_30049:317-1177(+)